MSGPLTEAQKAAALAKLISEQVARAAAPPSTRDIARQRRRMTSDMGETDAERMARAALEGRRGVWEQEYAEAAARAAAPPVGPGPAHSDDQHRAGYREDCPACQWADANLAVPPSPNRTAAPPVPCCTDTLGMPVPCQHPPSPDRPAELREYVEAWDRGEDVGVATLIEAVRAALLDSDKPRPPHMHVRCRDEDCPFAWEGEHCSVENCGTFFETPK